MNSGSEENSLEEMRNIIDLVPHFEFISFQDRIDVFLKRFYLFIFREGERKEKERERNINVWLPLVRPLLGTWPGPHPMHVP